MKQKKLIRKKRPKLEGPTHRGCWRLYDGQQAEIARLKEALRYVIRNTQEYRDEYLLEPPHTVIDNGQELHDMARQVAETNIRVAQGALDGTWPPPKGEYS